jgi:hypothetical protein
MADSENSRTLLKMTRRSLLMSPAATLDPLPAMSRHLRQLPGPNASASDPVVIIWRQWNAANARRCKLCYRQQRLERALMGLRKSKWEGDPEIVAAKLEYQKAQRDEMAALTAEEALSRTLLNTPASSIIGAIAKLHSVIETEDPGIGFGETPWPELRTILADLIRIDARVDLV